MAHKLLHKRSSVKDNIPTTSVAEIGELLLNTNAESPMIATRTSSNTIAVFRDKTYNDAAYQSKGGYLSASTKYAASDSVGGSANSTKGTLTITSNGTSIGTFNGSSSVTAATTDQKVADAASNAKTFLLGHATQATTATTTSNSNVYMSAGTLNAKEMQVDAKGKMVYNSTTNSIDFLFL